MTNVYVSSTDRTQNVSFHASPDCRFLLHGIRTRGSDVSKVQEVSIESLTGAMRKPCRSCYPNQPKVDVTRARCQICNPHRLVPCRHNGGVLVEMVQPGAWTTGIQGKFYDPELETKRLVWTWPEHAFRYRLVETPEQG